MAHDGGTGIGEIFGGIKDREIGPSLEVIVFNHLGPCLLDRTEACCMVPGDNILFMCEMLHCIGCGVVCR